MARMLPASQRNCYCLPAAIAASEDVMMICLLFRACGGSEERQSHSTGTHSPSMGQRPRPGLDLGVVQPLEWRHYSWRDAGCGV